MEVEAYRVELVEIGLERAVRLGLRVRVNPNSY